MRFFRHLLMALSLVAASAGAAPNNPQNGVDYLSLDQPQQADAGNKVEVIEFFWYSCPHCNALEPDLQAWVKKQGDNIVFKRVPVMFRDSMVPEQKLYYTLEAMGLVEQYHSKVFHAIHSQRQRLNTDAAILDFAAKNGIDKQKFSETYNSFGVQTKVARAKQLQTAYKVDGVPLLAVDGRYLTSPSIVGQQLRGASEPALHAATFQVLDWLVNKSKK